MARELIMAFKKTNEGKITRTAIVDMKQETALEVLVPFGTKISKVGA